MIYSDIYECIPLRNQMFVSNTQTESFNSRKRNK